MSPSCEMEHYHLCSVNDTQREHTYIYKWHNENNKHTHVHSGPLIYIIDAHLRMKTLTNEDVFQTSSKNFSPIYS